MVCYTGNNWWVVPDKNTRYPPDNQTIPIKMGLFWMCIQEHCLYDLSVDYMIVRYLPYKEIQQAYQNYRTVCMGIITVGMLFLCLSLGCHFIFLSAFKYSHLSGFLSGGFQIVSGVVTLIGLIIFGVKFRGSSQITPFGWSYWLMLITLICIIANGVVVSVLTVLILLSRKNNMNISDFNQPLKSSF